MMKKLSPALADFSPAFADGGRTCVRYFSRGADGELMEEALTRGELWGLGRRAAAALLDAGLGRGDGFTLCFGRNHYHDLAFRLAAIMIGAVPVTINWQADPLDRIFYKLELSESRLLVHDRVFSAETLASVKARRPELGFYDADRLGSAPMLAEDRFYAGADLGPDSTQMTVFTSGTTGHPKGVMLTYHNYETNRRTFDHWLGLKPETPLTVVAVNPLHHGNSTSMLDYVMRRPGAQVYLTERYFGAFWQVLALAAEREPYLVVAPLVARHFDYLANLEAEGRLPLAPERLKAAMASVEFLLGSAPVGPTTVRRAQDYSGRTPHVRLGATENVLQNVGTPFQMGDAARTRAFEQGWGHRLEGEPTPGYYIGRPHPPLTDARVVKSVQRGHAGFMADAEPGRPGYLVVKGGQLMKGYVKKPEATAAVFADGWYIGLGDVCFWLPNQDDGEPDIYWMSRESALLIRGGANYACDQINAELSDFIRDRYGLARTEFDLATAPLRVKTEHDDDCCVTLQLISDRARALAGSIEAEFIAAARKAVTKGAKPDFLRLAPVPRNFKGAILLPELKQEFKAWIEKERERRSS